MRRLLPALACLLFAAPARADFLTVAPDSEAHQSIRESTGVATVSPGPLDSIHVIFNNETFERGALMFDLRPFHGQNIQDATLTIHITSLVSPAAPNTTTPLLVDGLVSPSGAIEFPPVGDHSNPIAALELRDPDPGSLPKDIFLTIDVTAFLAAQNNGNADFAGLLFSTDGSLNNSVIFDGSLAAEGDRPTLAVSFAVPEPASSALLGAGLLAIGAMGKIRARRRV